MFVIFLNLFYILILWVYLPKITAKEVGACSSSQDCSEDKACNQNLCLNPCLDFCPEEKSCYVTNHTASCSYYNFTKSRNPRDLFGDRDITYDDSVGFTFERLGEHYIYMQFKKTKNWRIYRLRGNGTHDRHLADYGQWHDFYETQVTYTIDNRVYMYAQHYDESRLNIGKDHYWFIQELLPGGKMGKKKSNGIWNNFYKKCFTYFSEGRTFLYCYSWKTDVWFIQELLPRGQLGKEISNGNWKEKGFNDDTNLKSQFTFNINEQQFYFAQSEDTYVYFIRKLLPGGFIGPKTDGPTKWDSYVPAVFAFSINNISYFYGQSSWDFQHKWQIRELVPDGSLGKYTDHGYWDSKYYHMCFPFTIGNRHFFHCVDYFSYEWFNRELLPGGKMGELWDSGNYDS